MKLISVNCPLLSLLLAVSQQFHILLCAREAGPNGTIDSDVTVTPHPSAMNRPLSVPEHFDDWGSCNLPLIGDDND